MKRTLLLANILLALLIAASVCFIYRRNIEAKAAEARFLKAKPQALPVLVFTTQPPAPAGAQAYVDNTVQKFLFSRDRNPNVVVKPTTQAPEPPMPALPALFGLFMVGDHPTIFLSAGGKPQRGYQAGDKVGDFTLVAFDDKTATFNWNQKEVTRTLEELAQNQSVAVAAVPAQTASVKPPSNEDNNGRPGADLGGDSRACLAGDDSPSGTVSADGYKKAVKSTPFGSICRWNK